MPSSRRSHRIKAINNSTAKGLLEEKFSASGLGGVAPSKASVDALSKLIRSGNAATVEKAVASIVRRAQHSSSTTRRSRARPSGSRVKVNFTKRNAKKSTAVSKRRVLPAPPAGTPYETCRTKCAMECLLKNTEKAFVRTLPAAAPAAAPASTQELRALFSSLPPPRAPKKAKGSETPYYHQLITS